MQTDQADVVAFLSSPAAWPGGRVEVIETHAGIVFLSGGTALKIKRAVKLPYLDFSTLEARRRILEREIELNSPQAPEIYLGLVAITREADGRLAVEGAGTPVEWGIRMRRFGQDQLLSQVVAQGVCDRTLTDALGDMVAHMHADAVRHEETGDPMPGTCAGVIHGLEQRRTDAIAAQLSRFEAGVARQLEHSAAIRQKRARQGFVRRCHGDLHLGNIVVWNGQPLPFDALEFDEALATIDTLYDLSFLLMDLWRRGAREVANQVLNRYVWRTGDIIDLEGLKALPLYLGVRAGIRAMVALDLAALSAGRSGALTADAVQTLEIADELLEPLPARLVAIGGLSGTGKSTVAAALAADLGAAPGALHLRSDMERKRLAGVEHFERLRASAYRPAVNALVYARVQARARAALLAGQCVIVDAVSAKPEERAEIETLAREAGVPFAGIWLEADPEVMKARVVSRKDDASDATAFVVEQQLGYDVGEVTWTRIGADGEAHAVIDRVRAALGLAAAT